ncbi:hypothetical protein Aple_061260 [Acrocarpospora pleiomorpha]|uniref:PLL-like beta propeller domain-containing protein n=2 Tax=Acrocarpospora pleiomorpha TaxID=90975 RepID=A0A5M3XPD8_9ACTN|nr:hypothetical protein Aple_061260 [Acrocarpospora pleiomorpha]
MRRKNLGQLMKRFMGLSVVAIMLTAVGISTATPASAAPTPLWGAAFGTNQDGRLEVFAFGGTTSDDLYHNWQRPSGGWSGWQPLGTIPGAVTGGAAVASNKDGRLEVFALTTNGTLHHMWQLAPNGGWSGWAQLGDFDVIGGLSAVTNKDGRIEVFVTGNQRLWSFYQFTPGGSWGLLDLGTPSASTSLGPVSGARNKDGRMEVFAVGAASSPYGGGLSSVYHKWQRIAGGDWSGWEPMGHCRTGIRAITTAANEDGRLEIISIEPNNGEYRADFCHKWQGFSGGWSGWQNLGNSQIDSTAPVAMASNLDGRIEAFTLRNNGTIQHMWQTAPNSGFSGWDTLGGTTGFTRQGLAVGRNGDGRLEVVGFRGDGQPYHIWQKTVGGAWSNWAPLESN